MRAGLMRFVRWTVLLLLLAPLSEAHAQATARVTAEENFRRDPNGTPLATVMPGAELSVISQQGGWAQVELTGWIWAPSVGATGRDGFDLSVRATGGENLRARPNGAIVAHRLGPDTGQFDLESRNGSITLVMPPNSSGQIDARTGRGVIKSDFVIDGPASIRKRRHLQGTIGSGDTAFTMSTLNGNIWITGSRI